MDPVLMTQHLLEMTFRSPATLPRRQDRLLGRLKSFAVALHIGPRADQTGPRSSDKEQTR